MIYPHPSTIWRYNPHNEHRIVLPSSWDIYTWGHGRRWSRSWKNPEFWPVGRTSR